MDGRTRAILAYAPPQTWNEGQRRLLIVRRYLEGEDRSAEAAVAHAEEIGIGRSLFYRLARIYAERDAPSKTRPDQATAVGAVVARAIEREGPAASHSQIFRTAMEISAQEGLAPPSWRMFRTSCLRQLAGSPMAVRMGLDARFAIDRAVLDLTIEAGDGRSEPAQLACLVDVWQGIVVRHMLCPGDPEPREAASLVEGDLVRAARIAVSKSDAVLLNASLRSAIARSGGILVPGRWHTGNAIRAAVGLKIGRVALLSRPPAKADVRRTVDLATARAVIDELMRRHRGDIP